MSASGKLLEESVPDHSGAEIFTELLKKPGVRIERIVSHGQASPPGFWYDQADGEWVMVVAGEAGLLLEGEAAPRRLGPGDWLDIPPHRRHRVAWTTPARPTVWLAVHYAASPPGHEG